MSISKRFILPLLLAALIGGVPTLAAAQPRLPGGHWHGGGGGWHGGGWHGGGWHGGGWHGGPGRWHGGGWHGGPGRWHGGYRDDGADAAVAAGIIGLAVGAMAADAARSGDRHVRWCLNRYRSYDPDSDTYLGYDGRRHYCR